MKEFIEYLKRENTIENLSNYYLKDKKSNLMDNNLIDTIKNFNDPEVYNEFGRNSNSFDSIDSNFDIFGTFYEKQLKHVEKKHLGEFYTPFKIIDYILNAIGFRSGNQIENKKLIDISCGSGSFLIRAIRVVIESFKKRLEKKEIFEITYKEAKTIIFKVKENVYGIDINPVACLLSQINFHYALFEMYKIVKKFETDFVLPMFNIYNFNTLLFFSPNFSQKLKNASFDFVIGNPPYLFIRDIPKDQRLLIENGDFKTNEGQYDYYQIFIEIGIRLLTNQGLLGYIVPDSLLALSNKITIRKFIYKTSKIKEIYIVGPQFDETAVSNVILIVQKENVEKNREDHRIQVKLPSIDNHTNNYILQKKVKEWNYQFLVNLNSKDINLLKYLSANFEKLADLEQKTEYKIVLGRGVELGKNGEIIFCTKCKLNFPLPKKELICPNCSKEIEHRAVEKIIHDEISSKNKKDYKLFLYSINRYKIKKYKYININKKGIKYKDFNLYEDRIIIRQLNEKDLICATYDSNLSLTSQSFYNLRIVETPLPEFNNYFLLGLINSSLLSYYFIKSFGSYKKLFPRILIERIRSLPIKIPVGEKEKTTSRKLAEHVKSILNNVGENEDSISSIQNEIDSLVYDLYEIPLANRPYITKITRSKN